MSLMPNENLRLRSDYPGDNQSLEIESLRQQLAEKDAEIERLKSENRDACVGLNDYFGQQLAAGQAREQQLRNLMTMHMDNSHHGNGYIEEALDLSTDTSALSAIVTKAGEVMRERCLRGIWYMPSPQEEAIRALPGVTMEDLQK